MENTCCWCLLWMIYNAMKSKSSKNTKMRKRNKDKKLCTETTMKLLRCWHLETQTYPKVWRPYEVQVIQSVPIFSHTSDTKVCRSYQVQVKNKCADLLRYRWYKSVQILSGTGDTKVCRSYQLQVIQKCAGLKRYRWYKSVQIFAGTDETKVCRPYAVQVI